MNSRPKDSVGDVTGAAQDISFMMPNASAREAGACPPINSIAQILAHPASGNVIEYSHDSAGRLNAVGQPVLINGDLRADSTPTKS
jgi:hypothetical protein